MAYRIANAENDHYCEECENFYHTKDGNCRCRKYGISIRWYQYAMNSCYTPKPVRKCDSL